MVHDLLFHLQASTIALGVFVCFWGLTEFGRCLIEVLMGRHNRINNSRCPAHAAAAMICITGLIFCFARSNTIGLINIGPKLSGYTFIGGMLGFCMIIALAIWGKARANITDTLNAIPQHPALSRIFLAMLVIVLAFTFVGVIRAGQ